VRPIGNNGWEIVAQRYCEASGEVDPREVKDLKSHWVNKLCNNFKKPTGKTGEAGDRINRCIEIERQIQLQTDAAIYGASSGEEEREDYFSTGMGDDDISDMGGEESFDNNNDGDPSDSIDLRTATSAVAPVVAPDVAPVDVRIRGGSGSASFTADQRSTPQNAVSGGNSTTSSNPSTRQQRSRSSTPVFSSNSGGKTKNSTNRDRASVTKSIQDLTSVMASRMSSGGNSNELGFATIQMQMMQQSQMQMQMQLAEMKEQGKQSLKFLKAIAKQGKKKRKRSGDKSSSPSSSSSDESDDSN